ncbi:MAG: anthranilate synthase component I family protein [Thermoleophilia bacterium]
MSSAKRIATVGGAGAVGCGAERRFAPVVRRVPADTETPVSTYLKVASGPWSFLFESVEGGTRWGRYSIVGFDPFLTFEVRDGRALIRTDGAESESDDPVAALRALLGSYTMAAAPGLTRFTGGLVGYLGYDAARLFNGRPAAVGSGGRLPRASGRSDAAEEPQIRLFSPRKIIAFDNVRKTLDVMVLVEQGHGADSRAVVAAEAEIDEILERLRTPLPPEAILPPTRPVPRVEPLVSRSEFEGMVARARESILAGEAIQVVVSHPFEGETSIDPFTAYRALRAVDPTPYLFYLSLDEETLVGASPEVMLRVEDGRALLRPIAGTRPRGANEDHDRALEADLLADPKERAEHVMLVDLGRNDLGRVAQPGTVRLEESFAVERYSHVMHLVSTVSADLRAGLDGLDALMAAFPAGTVSGAPKVRAMELIAELERRPRGVYAGAVGYLGFDGDLDTCIAIRTMVFRGGRVRIQAGAGVVADSEPAREYEETLHKARALLRALESAAAGLVPEAPPRVAGAASPGAGVMPTLPSTTQEATPCCS